MTAIEPFRKQYTFEQRASEATKIKERHPQRIPVIVEKYSKCNLPEIDKKKYLVPGDLTVGQFVYVIRKRIDLGAERTLYIFIDGILPAPGELMMSVYERQKDPDGFLYVVYHVEKGLG